MDDSTQKQPKPLYNLGDLVVIKTYPITNPLVGDPLHIPPIMVVIGIEIENKNKKTHDTNLGEIIAERVKYHLIWFDNKKSVFVEKVMYESFLKVFHRHDEEIFTYKFGGKAQFRTAPHELDKKKSSSTFSLSNRETTEKGTSKTSNIETETDTTTSLVTFACPDLVITGIKKNDNKEAFNDFGNANKIETERLIKVMWFNPNQQKYSEAEIPQECLINIDEETTKDIEVHEKEV